MAAAALVVAVVPAPTAYAHDHRVPKTVLMKANQDFQTGIKVMDYRWIYPSSGTICAFQQATLVHNQATSRGMDRCSLCGQPKTRLEFSWTLL